MFPTNSSFGSNWVVKLGTSSLPIELINFNAIRNDNNAVLTWQTANEINSSHFNIERSLDGVHFNTIASIKAAGNSNSILNYSYTDSNIVKLNASKIYYRLQQIDRDGKSKLSRIIVLYISGIAFEMQILPNPTINELSVRIATNKAQSVQIVVSDGIGKKLITDKRKLITGINNIFYNTALWAKGIYLIKVFMTDGSSKSIKVIKQ